MSRAIFYLTYNGVFNNTNGIGTQTKTFLSGISHHYDALRAEFGEFAVHLVAPVPNDQWWGYSAADLDYARALTARFGGAVHFCPYSMVDTMPIQPSQREPNGPHPNPLPMGEGWGEGSTPDDIFWTSASWQVVSTAAAAIVLNEAVNYEQTLLIANDIPFLHAPAIVERAKRDFQVQIQSLIALYGSSYIHLRDAIDPARLTWEQSSLGTPAIYPDIKLAHYSNFMRRHFVERYAVEESHFVPYASSLTIEHDDFAPLREDQIERILCRYGIPLDRPLILAFGRADRVKGFDILLNSLDAVRDRVHLVLNVVPYVPNAPIIGEYCTAIREHGLKVTLLKEYSRALPMALSQWKKTRIVVCPSRGEPLSNIPFEVSLWARDQGPVLLCSNVDGFPEQIEHGVNGFLFDVDAKGELEASIAQILRLDDETCSVIRRNAYERVVRERDFYRNFREMLRCYWRG